MSVDNPSDVNNPAPAPAPAGDPAPAPAPAPVAAAPAPTLEQPAPPAPQPAPTPTPTPEPAKAEVSWRDLVAGIPDEKLRNVGNRLTSLPDALKAIIDLRTDNSQRIKVPGEGASEEDIAKFRKALGVPDKVEGYKITPPEGIEMTDADSAMLEAALPIAHKYGIPQAAMQEFVAEQLKLSNGIQQAVIAEIGKFHDQTVNDLKREWGKDYEGNLNVANRAREAIGGDSFKSFLNDTVLSSGGKLGDHPEMARFLAKIGRRMDEGDVMLGATPQERSNIQAEIDALRKAVPATHPDYTNPAHQAKLQALYEKLHGNASIIGSGLRVA